MTIGERKMYAGGTIKWENRGKYVTGDVLQDSLDR